MTNSVATTNTPYFTEDEFNGSTTINLHSTSVLFEGALRRDINILTAELLLAKDKGESI